MTTSKPLRILVFLIAAGLAAALLWNLRTPSGPAAPGTRAWGHVDTREISLAFEASGRIAEMIPEEGVRVEAGAVMGKLDTELLGIQLKLAEANARAAEADLALAREGYRKEDITEAERKTEALTTQAQLAARTAARLENLAKADAASEQALDDARFAAKAAKEELAAAKAQLSRLHAGLRPQEVAKAEAAAAAAREEVRSITYRMEKASVLRAPIAGVVRSRLAEPGDMASAARTVFKLSVTDPKWVRAYVTEAQLGLVKEGSRALVMTDTTEPLEATVAFISSTAEFTPKTVQTEELRTALVYEVKLTLADPENRLRLGQPVTVEFAP